MNDDIDPVYGASQAVFVTDIASQKPTAVVVKFALESGETRLTLVENPDDVRVSPKESSYQYSAD